MRTVPNPTCAHVRRIRLFNKGDAMSEQFKISKLKREFKKMNELAQMIYWADVGREGSNYFEQLVQQKKMAESLKDAIPGEVTTEKAQKMIAKAVEVQRKADADRSAKSRGKSAASASAPKPRYNNRRQHGNRRDSDSNRDRQRSRNSAAKNYRGSANKQRGKGSARPAASGGAPTSNRA